jgi:hypothetical protein
MIATESWQMCYKILGLSGHFPWYYPLTKGIRKIFNRLLPLYTETIFRKVETAKLVEKKAKLVGGDQYSTIITTGNSPWYCKILEFYGYFPGTPRSQKG